MAVAQHTDRRLGVRNAQPGVHLLAGGRVHDDAAHFALVGGDDQRIGVFVDRVCVVVYTDGGRLYDEKTEYMLVVMRLFVRLVSLNSVLMCLVHCASKFHYSVKSNTKIGR